MKPLSGEKGFPHGSAGKESVCNEGDLGSIPGLGTSPGQWKGYLLQYSGPENSMGCPLRTEEYVFLSEKQVAGYGALDGHP